MQRLFKLGVILTMCLGLTFSNTALAYEIPQENSKAEFFYVFGSDGSKYRGAEDSTQSIYFDVPAGEKLTLAVFDPDTVKSPDNRGGFRWDTDTQFTVEGSGVLKEVVVSGGDKTYHRQYLTFGPFAAEKGKKVGNKYRFKLTAQAMEGNDQNLFKVEVSPHNVESFVHDITFRLVSESGAKMYFYPHVPDGAKTLTVYNYDLDPSGGTSKLYDNEGNQVYDIKDSDSGKWAKTNIPLGPSESRRLVYEVTKRYQIGANAGIRIVDQNGNVVPIYFKGPEPRVSKPKVIPPAPAPKKPVLACNRFVFDARDSYDPNNDKISYNWSFGDGASSTEPVVEHIYEKGGKYVVTLTVSDHSGLECETAVTKQHVDVNTPPVAAMKGPNKSCTGQTVTFNASASKDDSPANLSYYWNFGDGTTGEGANVTHTYQQGGKYNVTLTVDDNSGTTCATDTISQVIHVNAPPMADAGEDIVMNLQSPSASYQVSLDGSRSSDPDGDALSYYWDLGDGSKAEGKRVEHVYDKGGNYTAKLLVNDNSGTPCSTDADTVNIELNKGPVAEAGAPQAACVGQELVFDGSQSFVDPGIPANFTWDFGDGSTGTGKVVKHRYKAGGDYRVMLTVDDGRGTPVSQSMDSVSVTLNTPPRAQLAQVGIACAGDKLSFDASGSSDADGDRLTYTWDFGDGTVINGGSKESHRYEKGGDYRVRVTVDDGSGQRCSSSTAAIKVKLNTPPVANTGPNLVCCTDQVSSFDGSSSMDPDGDSLSYVWDFGDGQGSTEGPKVSHSYSQSGTYNISLTVDEGRGTQCSSSSAGFRADVNAKPVPVIKVQRK